MPTAWQGTPKRWRVQGKATDGLVVTLGRFDTEEEARAECARLVAEATYRELTVQPIAPPPATSSPAADTTSAQKPRNK